MQRPCFREFWEDLTLPASDFGPEECWALRRLASSCFWEDMSSPFFRRGRRMRMVGRAPPYEEEVSHPWMPNTLTGPPGALGRINIDGIGWKSIGK